jgi:hypothetical protein
MAHPLAARQWGWLAAALVIAAATPAAASCDQVRQLFAQGHSLADIAAEFGAPLGAVQACVQPRGASAPSNRINGVGVPSSSAAGPAPLGAAGPAPLGAAGPAPLGAAGPAPLGAAGPAPLGAAGPAPSNAGRSMPVGSGAQAKPAAK